MEPIENFFTIKTSKNIGDDPLFITCLYEYNNLNLWLHTKDQDYTNENYGILEIKSDVPRPYNKYGDDGVYLKKFYMYPPKENNLKGMGKYMLCVAISIYIKHQEIDNIYLRAYGQRYNKQLQEKMKTQTGEQIYDYYLKNDNDLWSFNNIAENYKIEGSIGEYIDKNELFKEELIEKASEIEENKKLISYYSKEYGFVVINDRNKADVFMKNNITNMYNVCLKKTFTS